MDLIDLWERLLDALRRHIGQQEVEIWLADAKIVSLDDQRMIIQVSNQIYADWIHENYLSAFVDAIRAELGGTPEVQFTYGRPPEGIAALPQQVGPETERSEMPRSMGLNTRQTFDAFVVGECNRFAHAASRAVADHPARNYNPLFIYGSTGLGKTHLMHAIGNQVVGGANARVVYVTAEDFTNEMINGIRFERMNAFRNKYRRAATVLLVDDVQFLSGKERTQEEFFHTFNALQASGRQIVLTADVVPKDIKGLEPRLRTRFEGGLLADMQAPDPETLLAILRMKADVLQLEVPGPLAEAIVQRVAGNVRELEGVLNRLCALRNVYDEPLSLSFAQSHLPKVFEPSPTRLTVTTIIEEVARYHNLRSAELTGNKRTRTLTRPRHMAMYLARVHTQLSFPELGREFGGRDHSTIQHGYRKVKKELAKNPDLAHRVRLIEQALQVRGS